MQFPGRATNLADFQILQDLVFSEESRRKALAFIPKTDDILICPFAKSGTTWLQHIAHGLRSRGNLTFEEISFEIPWMEATHDLGIDLNAAQCGDPRIFKSHFNWHDVPKGGRYVCSIRDPEDVVISYYRFMEGWFIEPGTIDLDSFADAFCPQSDKLDGYWLHLVSWWEQRHRENVLLLSYEDMIGDLSGTVESIARFMGLETERDLIGLVARQSTREFMLKHKEKFDERGIRKLAELRAGLPFGSEAFKVTSGINKRARSYQLSAATKQKFKDVWKALVQPSLGLANYVDLRAELRREAI